jgi:hypothetical protein
VLEIGIGIKNCYLANFCSFFLNFSHILDLEFHHVLEIKELGFLI